MLYIKVVVVMTERDRVLLCLHNMIEELESAWPTLYVVHLCSSSQDRKRLCPPMSTYYDRRARVSVSLTACYTCR